MVPGNWLALIAAAITVAAPCGCRSRENASVVSIRVDGSDTMVNVAQAWAENYHKKHPDISVQVLGSGSGVGIASLTDGNCDMANSSRRMTETEIENAQKKQRGRTPKEYIVGYDALAIYVNLGNPTESIAVEDLADIYGERGDVTRWSQLGVDGMRSDQIIRIGRQNSSGTYTYFRQAVLGKKRDFKLVSVDANGSKDVVALVSRTPSAIGYSGMGYQTPDVRTLKVAKKRGGPAAAPTVATTRSGEYPITRPLLIYTLGEPTGPLKDYLDWIRSPEGQAIVAELGYVPTAGVAELK
jgi:phosphate transport system substrate-binding protein